MGLIDIDGTASGTGDVAGTVGLLQNLTESLGGTGGTNVPLNPLHNFGGVLSGTSMTAATTQQIYSFSGFAGGSGDLIDGTLASIAGIASGTSLVTGNLFRIIDVGGFAAGHGRFDVSIPEPIFGIGILTGFLEVIRIPRPACPPSCPRATFRWGHTLGPGDLTICIHDASGNPITPASISYSLYWVQRGCVPHLTGCCGRVPAAFHGSVGHFYVTGTAGEGGQPGLWLVKWKYQITFGGPVLEQETCFVVVDSVLSHVPGDETQRFCKYGWD